ncbi:hypothetical protein ANDA3_3743 [plant metagenome]|uniref:Mu-like prophage FluMu N-terminal domain-containing protein n=1 Tax=plant metagenome TaxID=1297885 RepID=A0A484T6T3_9ZZZZ
MATRKTAAQPTSKPPRAAKPTAKPAAQPDQPGQQPVPQQLAESSGTPAGSDAAATPAATAAPTATTPPQIECVIVTSRPLTHRRAGMRFTREPLGIALDVLTPEQLEALESDPDLVVQHCSIDAPTAQEQ